MLISIDGIDGCGKSTQVNQLTTTLQAESIIEISDSRWGRTLRALEDPTLGQQLAYFIADRAGLVPKLEEAAGSETRHIVSDRSYLSSVAYQSYNSGLSPLLLEEINQSLVPEYDLMIVLHLPVDVALDRVAKRGLKLAWCERPGRLTWAARVLETWAADRDNIALIDATQSIEEVSRDVIAAAAAASMSKFGKVVWQ